MAGTPSIEVVGTLFRVTMASGRILTSPELIGALIEVRNEAGRTMTVRIDAVARDPTDPDGDVWLHRLSVRNPGTGVGTRSFAALPPMALPEVSLWPAAGPKTDDTCMHIELRPRSHLRLGRHRRKCVRFGYKPLGP